MIAASARSASFASADVGNAAATSGSSTTTALPAAYRAAYLFGAAPEKLYSGRISSALVAVRLLDVFFIAPPFVTSRLARADDTNRITPFDVHNCQQAAPVRTTEQYQ